MTLSDWHRDELPDDWEQSPDIVDYLLGDELGESFTPRDDLKGAVIDCPRCVQS